MLPRSVLCLFLTGILLSIPLFTPAILAGQDTSITPALLNELVSGIVSRPEDTARRLLVGEGYPSAVRKCATPIVRMAFAHPDWLTEENRVILYRPYDNPLIRYSLTDGTVNLAYDTTHFRIHYDESGLHAVYGSDGDPNTIPDFVVDFGNYFEYAWEYETKTMGYEEPPPDGTNGGNDKVDVYIQDIPCYEIILYWVEQSFRFASFKQAYTEIISICFFITSDINNATLLIS